MLIAFIDTLQLVRLEKGIVSRLWSSFWTSLQRGLQDAMHGSEDRVAIEEIAKILGAMRAAKDQEANAKVLFEKAKIGLEAGTARETWLNNEYVNTAARQEMAKKETR